MELKSDSLLATGSDLTCEQVSRLARAARSDLREVKAQNRSPELIAERRREIVDAAVTEFDHHGFQSTTVESIAAVIGIDKRTIYDYVERKEDILFLILSDFLVSQIEALEEIRSNPTTAIARLREMLAWQLVYNRENYKMIVFTYREMRSLLADDIHSALKLVQLLIAEYWAVVSDAMRENAVDVDDPMLVAHAITTMVDMRCLRNWALAGVEDERIIELIMAMVGAVEADAPEARA